jgi:hypothetical protein
MESQNLGILGIDRYMSTTASQANREDGAAQRGEDSLASNNILQLLSPEIQRKNYLINPYGSKSHYSRPPAVPTPSEPLLVAEVGEEVTTIALLNTGVCDH